MIKIKSLGIITDENIDNIVIGDRDNCDISITVPLNIENLSPEIRDYIQADLYNSNDEFNIVNGNSLVVEWQLEYNFDLDTIALDFNFCRWFYDCIPKQSNDEFDCDNGYPIELSGDEFDAIRENILFPAIRKMMCD